MMVREQIRFLDFRFDFSYLVCSSWLFHINGTKKNSRHDALFALSRDCLDQSDYALYRVIILSLSFKKVGELALLLS